MSIKIIKEMKKIRKYTHQIQQRNEKKLGNIAIRINTKIKKKKKNIYICCQNQQRNGENEKI